MNDIIVSIIIPVYNTEKYIKDCLESCINQTYKNFEIIVIDDKSEDNSLKIAYEILNKSNCIYNIIEKNRRLGVSNSRNIGISVAKGKYIYFLDSDDIIRNDTLQILIEEINKNNYDSL